MKVGEFGFIVPWTPSDTWEIHKTGQGSTSVALFKTTDGYFKFDPQADITITIASLTTLVETFNLLAETENEFKHLAHDFLYGLKNLYTRFHMNW